MNILSSKSLKRFLVNFQITKAITPSTATPPATAIPTIEPVPRPESSSLSDAEPLDAVDDADADVPVAALVFVTVIVTSSPCELVVTTLEVTGGGGVVEVLVADVGCCDVCLSVVDVVDWAVGVVLSVVVDVDEVEVVVVVAWVVVPPVVVVSLPPSGMLRERPLCRGCSAALANATARRHERRRLRDGFMWDGVLRGDSRVRKGCRRRMRTLNVAVNDEQKRRR